MFALYVTCFEIGQAAGKYSVRNEIVTIRHIWRYSEFLHSGPAVGSFLYVHGGFSFPLLVLGVSGAVLLALAAFALPDIGDVADDTGSEVKLWTRFQVLFHENLDESFLGGGRCQ